MSKRTVTSGKQSVLTAAMVSLGCPKNTVDAEYILKILKDHAVQITAIPAQADIILINTCGFIQAAREEARETIEEMLEYKTTGKLKKLIITGCMADTDREVLRNQNPGIDAFLSPFHLERVMDVVNGREESAMPASVHPPEFLPLSRRLLTTPLSYAYVKVSDGCNHTCAFCRIPRLRGPYRSKSVDAVVREVDSLVSAGIREIVLISQDTSAYGRDIGTDLCGLLDALETLPGLFRLRVMYLHPSGITSGLLDRFARYPRLCKYLDIPLQHVNSGVLKRMNRSGNPTTIRRKIREIRSQIPEVTLRSTFITGFPGETAVAFEELSEFLSEGWIDHVGVFTYSEEPDTPAAHLSDSIPEETARERAELLMQNQYNLLRKRNKLFIGNVIDALIDSVLPEDKTKCIGRMESQAPEIDSRLIISGSIPVGTVLPVRITQADAYDLFAQPIPE